MDEGLAALSWPSVPGEVIYASFYSEYNAEVSAVGRGEARDNYTYLLVAFWVPDSNGQAQPFVTRRFDTASGLWEQPGVFAGRAHEIRHVLNAGNTLRVHYDPRDPERAVIYPGLPWSFTTLLIVPVMFLGLAVGFVRWSAEPGRNGREASEPANSHLEPLIVWASVFPLGMAALTFSLPAVSVYFMDHLMAWWILPSVFSLFLALYLVPSILNLAPVRWAVLGLLLLAPLELAASLGVLWATDHRAAFSQEWSDVELVDKLGSNHPEMAEHAARTVMRRKGPRAAAPALEALLRSPSIDTRGAASSALSRIGIAALPALGEVESALEDPRNTEIRDRLESTRKHLRSYLWSKEQVEKYRYRLLNEENEQARSGAAFSLAQFGEAALPALPNLERAARDPRNEQWASVMRDAIKTLRRYQRAEGGATGRPTSAL